MLGRIIFCAAIAAAVLAVVLLATVSPLPRRTAAGHKGGGGQHHTRTLTVYIHPTPASSAEAVSRQREHGAFVFRHRVTEGPEIASRTVGVATGFAIRGEAGAAAVEVFDTVHLAFDAEGMMSSGSVCVQAATGGGGEKKAATRRRRGECGGGEEVAVRVVGGTGAFAFMASGEGVVRAECSPAATRVFGGGNAAAKVLRLELSVATT
uniref:Dirigent protein n=1 Tax=Leersia perrieri TaxID=77586 RepID=A0A0D9VYS7_9ORYZ